MFSSQSAKALGCVHIANTDGKDFYMSDTAKRDEFSANERIIFIDHPLVQHKISLLRDKETRTREFRSLVKEITMLEGYEALRDAPLAMADVETPLIKCRTPILAGLSPAVVPILRAGLTMTEGFLSLLPTAKVGHIGLCRDPETHQPQEYYCKLPSTIEDRLVLVLDPILATGGSSSFALSLIKRHGGKRIKFMCIIAAPEGLRKLSADHPDVPIYVGHLDDRLNENAYILPGLGDAGDRIFGTV